MKYISTLLTLFLPFFIFSQTLLPQQEHSIVGGRSVLVIRGVDPATHTWKDTDQDLINFENSLDEYLKKVSFNKTWLETFDITPIYEFTVDPNNNGHAQMTTILNAMAINGGYDVGSYNTAVFIHQSTTDFGGAGALGSGNGLHGSVKGNNNLTFFTAGLIHETFHTYGVNHAEAIEGGDNIFPGEPTGGVDPYHFMGSEGDAGLNSDIPSYMKYLIGLINPSEIELVTNVSGCNNVYRLYKNALVANYNNTHKYAIQLGEDLWISYDPDNQNTRLEKKGLVFHYIENPESRTTKILDTNPNSISTLPDGVSSAFNIVIDFWDSAIESGEELYWKGLTIKPINEGGSGDEKWVDVEICNCVSESGDADNDGICDSYDVCPGEDDTADADVDSIPDSCDTCPNDPGNDSNNNNICDNIECLESAEDHFDYSTNNTLDNNNGGNGFSNEWSIDDLNGSINVIPGSLNYPNLNSTGNKVRMALLNETSSKSINRSLNNTFSTGETLWLSILIKGTNVANGGIWIKPNNAQTIAIGKRWGDKFSIDNGNSSGSRMIAGETNYLVARYKLLRDETIVHLWLNRSDNFTESNAITSAIINEGFNINSITISMERFGDGVIEFDNLTFSCSAPKLNTLSNASFYKDKEPEVIIFPNPTKDKLHIKTNNVSNFTTKIIDISGRLILNGKKNNSIIDVSNIDDGIYFMKFYNVDSKSTQTIKIVVKK